MNETSGSARSITEHEPIERKSLSPAACSALQRLDEQRAEKAGQTIFDWSRRATLRARSWVGVVQVPGLSIEILPKIEGLQHAEARRNLLFMLDMAGELSSRQRDLASLAVGPGSLLEALILLFSERLLAELRVGLDHAYTPREESAGFVRGKLLLREHLVRNAAHKERVFIAFDDFMSDTPLNRIFKRTCRILVGRTRGRVAERNLRAALLAFDDVQDVEIGAHHFDQVQLSRLSDRFETLLGFCRIVLLDGAPSPHAGDRSTFSLLFPMEKVFERFVAQALRRCSPHLELEPWRVDVQGRSAPRWLASDGSRERFRLRPDIVIRGDDRPGLLIDTKWKRLRSERGNSDGVSPADMYQMVAYATAYSCDDSVLVFPRVSGAEPRRYLLQAAAPASRTIRVELIDLSRDLWTHREGLIADLRRVLGRTGDRGDQAAQVARPE